MFASFWSDLLCDFMLYKQGIGNVVTKPILGISLWLEGRATSTLLTKLFFCILTNIKWHALDILLQGRHCVGQLVIKQITCILYLKALDRMLVDL
jgi:hypothetical protein